MPENEVKPLTAEEREEIRKRIGAAKNMDWQQVQMNGGPPCFYLQPEDGLFCGRAQSWIGHDEHHTFVSLDDLVEGTFLTSHSSILHLLATISKLEARLQPFLDAVKREGDYLDAEGLVDAFIKEQERLREEVSKLEAERDEAKKNHEKGDLQ